MCMKKTFVALVLGTLLTIPCALHAEEVEILLMEVVGMGTINGDNPLDSPDKEGETPTRPTDFHATINGNQLSIVKQETAIQSAQAMVVNVSTGNMVLNRLFTHSLSEQITTAGIYALRISTATGDLVGQFIVQ